MLLRLQTQSQTVKLNFGSLAATVPSKVLCLILSEGRANADS